MHRSRVQEGEQSAQARRREAKAAVARGEPTEHGPQRAVSKCGLTRIKTMSAWPLEASSACLLYTSPSPRD
eukprot:8085706-Alexandrium_andersonii.AAC.1